MKKIFLSQPVFNGNELKYVSDCISSTWVRNGKYLGLFESKFANFCDSKYATSTSSGTSALHLLMLALDISKGDEVIVPDISYVASTNVVAYVGAKPVIVDVDKDTWTIDPKKVEERITKKTKAIIVVHLFGYPADMDAINSIAKKYKLLVVEDACQSHGATYKGKKTGSLANAGCFSFSGAKTITTGEGGMIVSNNKKLIDYALQINNDFMKNERKFYHSGIGYNFRMTNLQAALGLAQLEQIKSFLNIKRNNAKIYKSLLKDNPYIQLPAEKDWVDSSYWLYSIVLKKKNIRNKLMRFLDGNNIETRPFFTPMHELPMYKSKGDFIVSNFISQNGICLPSAITLKKNDIEFICELINKFVKKNG